MIDYLSAFLQDGKAVYDGNTLIVGDVSDVQSRKRVSDAITHVGAILHNGDPESLSSPSRHAEAAKQKIGSDLMREEIRALSSLGRRAHWDQIASQATSHGVIFGKPKNP